MEHLEAEGVEAMVLDSVLPDLEVGEFAVQMRSRYPEMDLLRVDAGADQVGARSPRRNELLHALRRAQLDGCGGDADGGARATLAAAVVVRSRNCVTTGKSWIGEGVELTVVAAEACELEEGNTKAEAAQASPFDEDSSGGGQTVRPRVLPLPEMVGESPAMLELARLVRLVAPRSASVLIEGETGTGKELVAKAVHRLSARASKPFAVLNCAAIPESLLEAELFGHTRGAFTGAVQSRTGRIEAAHGGTLFLDEIGEMPLALQAKMLRFLESGELQRVGDNEILKVDVRVVAASHQPLRQRAKEKVFRLDLYHRLAVFPVSIPALRDRMEDVPTLAEFLLGKLGEEMPVKRLSAGAAKRLMEYDWPGNVRELGHVLERGTILAEDRREIAREEIRF
jgi:transcriptional regulator with GAF, ATPase, and Fis domain